MNETLQINPKFEQIIPPLTADEFTQLEENILKLGRVTDSIKIWNGFIIDGHHRYKIIQKHPDIPYTTDEMSFDSEYEAIAWMCNAQLGRRNITEANRQYLLGKRYAAEKEIRGGDRKSEDQKSMVQIGPLISPHKTRQKLAVETNTNVSYIKNCDRFARGVDAAEEVVPGIRNKILTGEITPAKSEIYDLTKIPKEERKEAVELLLVPKDERNKSKEIAHQIEEAFANGTEQETEEEVPQEKFATIPTSAQTPYHTETDKEDSKEEEHEIEESILNSMIGAVNMFIDSINNYLSRFPRLRTDPKYRSQTREIMVAARDYINDVEGDLL